MNVGVELQLSIERVQYRNDANPQAELGTDPSLKRFRSQQWQKLRQVSVAKKRPKYIWHRERYAFVGDIRQCRPTLPLPLRSRTSPAA